MRRAKYRRSGSPRTLCECLKHCAECDRCAEPWVIVAVLKIDGDGIVPGSLNHPRLVNEEGGRRWVKPIACLCAADSGWSTHRSDILQYNREVDTRLSLIEQRLGVLDDGGSGTVKRARTKAAKA
jgi:hypothetical protein